MNNFSSLIPEYIIARDVTNALSEDLNNSTDWTANLIDDNKEGLAYIKTNQDMIMCGQSWARYAFYLTDNSVNIDWHVNEGELVTAGTRLCTIKGKSRALLTSERTALNFIQLLSGTATFANTYAKLVSGTKAKIMDTRKTVPGLRLAQKYAVLVGGGSNQRIGLFDGVLIKENHIIAHGGIKEVLEHAFKTVPKHIPIQIEVENFEELKTAVAHGATLILLDNMQYEEIRVCVNYCQGKNIQLEVSGNVNLETVREYALCGVDRISIGGLTKNVQAIDLSMRFI